MEEKTLVGLRWIVEILDANKIPYQIGGGLAAHLYGSPRAVNDIDISLSGKYFEQIIPLVSAYITEGPKHYVNEKWDCTTLSLNYEGQDIDMTDVDTLRMSNLNQTAWIQVRDIRLHEPVIMNVGGVSVRIMDPRDLLRYKNELGGEHQRVDITAIEKYSNVRGETSDRPK